MELWLIWIVAGFALMIAELLSGTFYLLVVSVGAFAGAAVAWLGGGVLLQAVIGSGVAIAGAVMVHHWHASRQNADAGRSNLLDLGQPVILEGWANEAARIARVKYRGAWWDAKLARPDEHPAPGSTLYIEGQEGNTLVVASAPPSR
jgi:membrane protein implicated in regulation of membrane protease activity